MGLVQDLRTTPGPRAAGLVGEAAADWNTIAFPDTGRLRSDGDWRVRDDVYVIGLHYYPTAVDRFFYAAWDRGLADPALKLAWAPQKGRPYGAVAVFGLLAPEPPRGLRRRSEPERLPLGYLPREIVAELAEAPTAPLSAELRECAWLPGDDNSKVVKLSVMIPRLNRFPDIRGGRS